MEHVDFVAIFLPNIHDHILGIFFLAFLPYGKRDWRVRSNQQCDLIDSIKYFLFILTLLLFFSVFAYSKNT